MNSLRALSSRARLLHPIERHRELSNLVGGVHGDRDREVALGDLLGGRLEPAQAPGVGARREKTGEQRREDGDRARDQDLAADQRHRVVDLVERVREDRHPAGLAAALERNGRLADALAIHELDRRARRSGRRGVGRRDVARHGRVELELGIADDEGGLLAARPHADQRHARVRLLGDVADEATQARLRDPGLHGTRHLRRLLGGGALRRSSRSAVRLERSWGTT